MDMESPPLQLCGSFTSAVQLLSWFHHTHSVLSLNRPAESPDNAEAEQEEPEQLKDSPQPSAPSGDANAAAGGRRNPPGGKSSLILG